MNRASLLFAVALLVLGCRDAPIPERTDATISSAAAPASRAPDLSERTSAPELIGPTTFQILSVSAHLLGSDQAEPTVDVLDNAAVRFWNVVADTLRIVVTVRAPSTNRADVRVDLWAREGDNEVYASHRTLSGVTGGSVHAFQFDVLRFGCKWLVLQASVSSTGPREAIAYRFLPFECGE